MRNDIHLIYLCVFLSNIKWESVVTFWINWINNVLITHSHFYQLIIIFNILGILYIYSENSLVAFMLYNMPCIFSKGIEKCQKLTTWDTFRQECVGSLPVKKHKITALVFCYQYCSDLLWEKLMKFEAESEFRKKTCARKREKAGLEKIWSHCVNRIPKNNHICSKNKF